MTTVTNDAYAGQRLSEAPTAFLMRLHRHVMGEVSAGHAWDSTHLDANSPYYVYGLSSKQLILAVTELNGGRRPTGNIWRLFMWSYAYLVTHGLQPRA